MPEVERIEVGALTQWGQIVAVLRTEERDAPVCLMGARRRELVAWVQIAGFGGPVDLLVRAYVRKMEG